MNLLRLGVSLEDVSAECYQEDTKIIRAFIEAKRKRFPKWTDDEIIRHYGASMLMRIMEEEVKREAGK